MSSSTTSGSLDTPTEWAMRSPSARLMANPGNRFFLTYTRCGISPSDFLTSPPMDSILFCSSGRLGLWSRVSSLALYLPDSFKLMIALESPTWATYSLLASVSITAIVQVEPLSVQSNSSVLSMCSSIFRWTVLNDSRKMFSILMLLLVYIFSRIRVGRCLAK